MNELEDSSVHSDTMAHYDACYGDNDMTCKDCNNYIERPKADWYTFNDLGFCDMACSERIIVNEDCPINKWCDNKFEPTHESVGNALDALDSRESVSK